MALVQWSTRFSQNSKVFSISHDSEKNVYSTGQYNTDDLDLYNSINSGDQTFTGKLSETVPFSGATASFISKYDKNGTLVWGARISTDSSFVQSEEIIVDGNRVYVVGRYSDDLDFYDSTSNFYPVMTLPYEGVSVNGFLACYSTDGSFEWATAMKGTSGAFNFGVTVQGSKVYVSGEQSSATDVEFFNAFTETPSPFTLGASVDTIIAGNYITCYTSTGTLEWVIRINPGGLSRPRVCSNTFGIFITGSAQAAANPVDFYDILSEALSPPSPSISLSLASNKQYVAMYSLTGVLIWATFIEINTNVTPAIACNETNVYVTGRFLGNADFYDSVEPTDSPADLGPIVLTLDEQVGSDRDAYLACYDTDGGFDWVVPVSGSSTRGNDVFVVNDQICITGQSNTSSTDIFFYDSVSVTPSPSVLTSVLSLSGNGSNDGFVSCYNPSGSFRWATLISGTGSDEGHSLTMTDECLYVGGKYSTPNTNFYDHASLFFPDLDLNSPVITQEFSGSSQNGFLVSYRLVSPSLRPCFSDDAMFHLDSGESKNVIDLKLGDRIVCKNGIETVANVFKMPVFQPQKLVRFNPGSISMNVPNQTLTLSNEHEIMYPDGGDGPCKAVVNGIDILELEEPVKYLYHVQIDSPGQIHYAKTNGGIWSDVWGNDNRLIGAMKNAQFHKF